MQTVIAREILKAKVAELAAKGVYIGTSSWKYPGWFGMLYERDRYIWRGRFAETRFQRNCLAEYAEVFQTVCVDAAYYTFPSEHYLQGLADQVGDNFKLGFKVTDEITIKTFPQLPRFGEKAGKPNDSFLNAERFAEEFLKPCVPIRSKVGLLIFEFSRFWPADYQRGKDFISELDAFLSRLPRDWPYSVELRNRNWLRDDYFECLARNRVTHVYNSWEGMPPVSEQLALPLSRTNPELMAARFLLKPGRRYEDAVKTFEPYDALKEEVPEARLAGRELIREGLNAQPKRQVFIYVNNRLEGNALGTISAMIDLPAQL